MGLNWLITGGCGFIGVNLVERLLENAGNRIRVLDNLSVGTRDDLDAVARFNEVSASDPTADDWGKNEADPIPVQLVVGDILDENLTMQAAVGADVIVHLAANTGVAPSVENPRLDCVTNVLGTLNMLEAARHGGVKRFVFASSGAPVGEVEPPIHEELAPHPVSPYGASKLAGEGYCSAYFRTFGIETVALRFGNVYGPRSSHKSSVVAKFIRQAMKGQTLEIYGDGKQTRDFIYIADLVCAIELAAARSSVGGETFQIATNSETTVHGLVQLMLPIFTEMGISNVRIRHGEARIGDVRRNYSDTRKAKAQLGWTPRVKLEMGLRTVMEWFSEWNHRERVD